MATKKTAKKQPFVIEPLNWVAPDQRDRNTDGSDDSKKASPAKESQD
ncbi:hypothetical protein ACMHYO_18405 [Allopusillimonas ginsengisoli]